MLDRIAAALMDTATAPHFRAVWADQPDDVKTHWRFMARAALMAMMEPTNEMHKAMCECFNSPVCIWMTGIKQALAVPNGHHGGAA